MVIFLFLDSTYKIVYVLIFLNLKAIFFTLNSIIFKANKNLWLFFTRNWALETFQGYLV